MEAIPDAISHRQLCAWLKQAAAEAEAPLAAPEPSADLDALLASYGQLSRQLLQALQERDGAIGNGRNPRQLMALGALRVHAQLALQALDASRS